MTVSLSVGAASVAVTAMVMGAPPQSNVTTPPFVTAASSAEKVQLAAFPVPTTVVGVEASAALPSAGTPALHLRSRLPALQGPTAVPPPMPSMPPVPDPAPPPGDEAPALPEPP